MTGLCAFGPTLNSARRNVMTNGWLMPWGDSCWLSFAWHKYSAHRREACGPSGPEDASDDGPNAEPSERCEGQQVHQCAGTWMKDPPQGET